MAMSTVMDLNALKSDLYNGDIFNNIPRNSDISNSPILDNEILPETNYLVQDTLSQQGNEITEEFPGVYNFEIFCSQGKGKNFLYSQTLRKIYIHMEQRLPLRFKWTPTENNLWLRTTLVYSDDQHRGEPVQRCHNHMAANCPSNQNVSNDTLQQVVRCMHPGSVYEKTDGHMSVTVPLGTPQPECNYVPLDFQFYCKNSCSSGMNRRATQLMFTLETAQRQIVGRRNLKLRVCSCPKRDKEKEEYDVNMCTKVEKKRRLPPFDTISSKLPPVPPGKKKMPIARQNSSEYLLNITLPNKEIAKEALFDIYKILSAKSTWSGNYQYFLPFLEDVRQKFNGF